MSFFSDLSSKKEEIFCYGLMLALTGLQLVSTVCPLQVYVACFSMACIIAGSYRSLHQMVDEFKKAYVDEQVEGEEKEQCIETMSAKDAKMFPIMAGGTLCFLYALIKFFGKDVVNKLIMVYLAVAIVEVFKELLIPVLGKKMDQDEAVLVKFKVEAIGLNVRISQMDIIGFAFSATFVGIYVWSDNWLLNNAIAIFISVQGIQQIFLDTFQVGYILLILLFFYDIFFVFGTDVMLTVAKGLKAPIKIYFATGYKEDGTRQLNLLGLGDIVLPGIFLALNLRWDVIRTLDKIKMQALVKAKKGAEAYELLKDAVVNAPKTYFRNCLIGYFIAIMITIFIMYIFDHGQPALLYLVPGVLGATSYTAFMEGELSGLMTSKLMTHTEAFWIGNPEEGEEAEKQAEAAKDAPVKETKAD